MASLAQANEYTNTIPYKLYMYVNHEDIDLNGIYNNKINVHNYNMLNDEFPDSGFDLFVPHETLMTYHTFTKVDFQVKCKMVRVLPDGREVPSAFYMYPRSSISKTNFRLANNVGIIDSGYRGNLGAMFDVVNVSSGVTEMRCEKHQRLVQICGPTLEPFKVVIVEEDSQLSTTQRGSGGFGSTGSGGCML